LNNCIISTGILTCNAKRKFILYACHCNEWL